MVCVKRYARARLFKQIRARYKGLLFLYLNFFESAIFPFRLYSLPSFHRNTADVFGKKFRGHRVFLFRYTYTCMHIPKKLAKSRRVAFRWLIKIICFRCSRTRGCNDRDKKKRKRGTLRMQYSCGVIIFPRYFPTNVFAVAGGVRK